MSTKPTESGSDYPSLPPSPSPSEDAPSGNGDEHLRVSSLPPRPASASSSHHGSTATLVDEDEGHSNASIHAFLQGLRLDDIVTLARMPRNARAVHEDSFPASFLDPLKAYIQYLYTTWSDIFRIFIHHEIPFSDLIWTVLFALLTSFILFGGLIWCQFANNPIVYMTYFAFSKKYAHNLGLINASDPELFNALHQEQVDVAQRKLGTSFEDATPSPNVRVFDLDIAKFLLQLSSIVYERRTKVIHATVEAINQTKRVKESNPENGVHHSAAARNAFDSDATRRNKQPDGKKLDKPSSISHTGEEPNHFSKPGELVKDLFEKAEKEAIEHAFMKAKCNEGEDVILGFCSRLNMNYAPVSELNTASTAFCSFFWSPDANWLVVTFKGTGIQEYADWVTDLTTTMIDSDDFIPSDSGRAKAVIGFKERLYSQKVSELGGTRAWDTIRFALCKVSEKLAKQRAARGQEGNINVWFTGHSLGSALASLAYTRILTTPSDIAGYPITIRDCYVFAVPVAGNRVLAHELNQTIARSSSLQTLWRVRNAGDAVVTLLPQLGDRHDLSKKLSPTNPAGLAHLGAEIIMRDAPILSTVNSPTSHLGPDDYDTVQVQVRTEFSPAKIRSWRRQTLAENMDKAREAFEKRAEKFPLIGRFIAHDTVLYWDQLDRIAAGPARWITPRPQ